MSWALWKRAASLLAGLLMALPSVANASVESSRADIKRDDVVYASCYMFTSGEPAAFLYPTFKSTGVEMGNDFDRNLYDILIPQNPQHHAIRCMVGDTPEQAVSMLSRHSYNFEPRPWPKGLPEAARPVYVDGKGYVPKGYGPDANQAYDPRGPWAACLKSQAGGPAITPAFQTNVPDHRAKLDADAMARFGSSDYVSCDYGQTREEVEGKIRNHYTSPAHDWPLPWLGGRQAAAPAPRSTDSSTPAAAGALIVKTDTSAKDAAKAWDEQVKKTLAAETQKRVETAAKQAQADAKLKAEYEAFFRERRRQGAAQ